MLLLCSKGQSLRHSPGQGNPLCCAVTLYVGEGPEREQCCLLRSVGFQSLPPQPTSKVGPSGAASQVGGSVYVLGPCGSLQQTLLWGWEFLLTPQSPQIFPARGLEALFPCVGTLGCTVYLTPQFFPVYLLAKVGPPSLPDTTFPGLPATFPGLPAPASPAQSSSCCLDTCPLPPGSPFHPLLSVWMNISSLTPWLSDFHTIWLSSNSGCFLFSNLLLSLFWLCKEAKCIYLHRHLGKKSTILF